MARASAVAAQLRAARLAKGWSQAELAKRAGVEQSTVSRLEAGKYDLGRRLLDALADALELELVEAVVPRASEPGE